MFNRTQKILQYYLFSGAVEGFLALAILFLIPADPKNAWVFGFSKSRLAIAAGLIAITAVFGWLARTFGKKHNPSQFADRVAEWVGNYPVYGPVMLFLYGLVSFGTYLFLNLAFQPLTTLQGILLRIFPVVFYAFTRLLQTIVVWIILARRSAKDRPPEKGERLIQMTPSKIATLLAGIAFFLILTSSMLDVIEALTWGQKFWGFRVKFDLDQEANIPTYFASLNLLIAAGLFTMIGMLKPKNKDFFAQHWLGLGLIFLLLSVDETSVLHEKFIDIFKLWFHPQGLFFFGWVILAIPLVALTALAYLRFFLHLPAKYRILIFSSITIYLAGAVGMEMIGGWYAENYNENNDFYNVLTTIEETLEPIGMITLIYTLLLYISENFKELKLRISNT